MSATPESRYDTLRARLTALGVPDDRVDRVAHALAERLAALDAVALEALERVPPATVFVPNSRRENEG